MKYFCPLENVGKIEGRKRNDTIVKTTTINGWEISSDGIYAGSNNTLTDLPIVSKNWSIDKNGNVITNGNITANNGIFKNIYALKNNFFIENRSGTYNLNVIHLDNFELIKNNTLNTLTLFGKHTKSPNESKTIVTLNEKGDSATNCYFQVDYGEGIKVPYLTIKNANNAVISGDVNGYLNLNNNLKLSPSSKYTLYEGSISRTKNNISYSYTLPNSSGQIMILDDNARIGQYYYDIELKADLYFITNNNTEILQTDCDIKNNELKTINKNEEKIIDYQNLGLSITTNKSKRTIKNIHITENKGINNLIIDIDGFSVSFNKNTTDPSMPREKDYIKGITIYRYSICGTKDIFKWKTDGTWVKIN